MTLTRDELQDFGCESCHKKSRRCRYWGGKDCVVMADAAARERVRAQRKLRTDGGFVSTAARRFAGHDDSRPVRSKGNPGGRRHD